MRASRFPRKHSVQFFAGDGRASDPFYFSEIDPHESSVTWQIDRAEFDRMLLEHAAESGAEVRQEASVLEVLFEASRAVGVLVEYPGKIHEEIRAKVIVDASGQAGLLSRKLGLKDEDPRLRNISLFTRYRGARRDPGIDEGATLIMHTAEGKSWFWYIPLPDDLASVGVVGSLDYLVRSRDSDTATVYAEELARCPALGGRLEGARQVGDIRAMRDFSYISRRIAGDGWILAGDAFGFLDPIYSSGVFLSLKAAEFTADAILDAFAHNDFSAARLGQHGPRFVQGMEAIRKLVYAFYDPGFSFSRFLKRHPDCREQVVHLLTGNVYRVPADTLLERLEEDLSIPDYRPLQLSEASS
jgi:flavin-dependent dehydrogenase